MTCLSVYMKCQSLPEPENGYRKTAFIVQGEADEEYNSQII